MAKGKMSTLGKAHSGAIKKPSFGGRPTAHDRPPDKKKLDALGGAPKRATGFDMNVPGNREFGFIQSTPKKATAAMMGRGLPPLKESSTRSDSKKQFKPRAGKKVF